MSEDLENKSPQELMESLCSHMAVVEDGLINISAKLEDFQKYLEMEVECGKIYKGLDSCAQDHLDKFNELFGKDG